MGKYDANGKGFFDKVGFWIEKNPRLAIIVGTTLVGGVAYGASAALTGSINSTGDEDNFSNHDINTSVIITSKDHSQYDKAISSLLDDLLELADNGTGAENDITPMVRVEPSDYSSRPIDISIKRVKDNTAYSNRLDKFDQDLGRIANLMSANKIK